jgi:cobalt/nickel transport system ATP-binding protein
VSPALTVDGLHAGWAGGPPVLRGVSLSIAAGERIGLVGPNGAGKTSLFLAIAGVLAPSAGAISVAGTPVRPGGFNPDVALVFQQSEDQLFCPTVAEDVAFGGRSLGLSGPELAARVARALDVCDLASLADRPVHQLSGGEKKRACIAGALVMEPALMLLDEPSAALDLRQRRRLIRLLQDLPAAMLIASHDLDLVLDLCHRVVLFDNGGVVADGCATAILGDAALMAAHGQEVPPRLVGGAAARPGAAV